MNVVGKVSSFITQGVYSVATPFHPFGGAVDIITVQQSDRSFKSTPWYVRFGKFQGVLKGAEKVVRIEVNGVQANFHMYLDNSGEAYFVREVVSGEDETVGILQLTNSFDGTIKDSGNNETDNDQKDDVLSKHESYDSSTGEFQLRDEHVALGVVDGLERIESDVERPFYDFQDVESSFEGSGELSEYGSARFDKLDMQNVIESENLSSEVVLVSVDGHILTAPISSMETNTEDVELNTPQTNNEDMELNTPQTNTEDVELNTPQGLGEGTDFSEGNTGPNDGESVLASDYLNDPHIPEHIDSAELSYMNNENNAFQSRLEICAGDGEDFDREEEIKDTIQEKELPIDSGLENRSALVKGDVFQSCLELTQLAMQDANSCQDDKGSTVEILEVVESSEDKSCPRSLPIDETGDANFGKSIEDGAALSNPGSSRSSPSTELQDQVEKLENNASDLNISGFDSRTDDFIGTNGEVDKQVDVASGQQSPASEAEFSTDSRTEHFAGPNGEVGKQVDVASGQQSPASEDEFSTNDNVEHTALTQDIPASEEAFSSVDDNVESQTTLSHEDVELAMRTIFDAGLEISLCENLLHPGIGESAAAEAFEMHIISEDEFRLSSASIIKSENLVVRIHGKYLPWDKAAPIILGMAAYGVELTVEPSDTIPVEQEDAIESKEGESGIPSTPPGRGWRLWPIPFRRGKTTDQTSTNSSSEVVFADPESGSQKQSKKATSTTRGKESPRKQRMRTNVPTSDQIASLDLKEGQNLVTFTSNSRVLGPQKVEAHIYLWKWNARIVISDVDGTITKSDVLGQFMPLVGKDWTHSGIARLFSAIKENGYQLLFLSARAIVQAYLTKSFLFNLKQDGKTLPVGPVVISPDGLFPSLYREVIRRAPHEFKIACLEDIKSLFPPDYNPFYAGFGNRDTDELSYRKIGIPKGKIFIINPKGEVAINHRIDVKSYTSLHTLVHDMFPPTSLVEQEDYNSWNYWKMPLPDIGNL